MTRRVTFTETGIETSSWFGSRHIHRDELVSIRVGLPVMAAIAGSVARTLVVTDQRKRSISCQ